MSLQYYISLVQFSPPPKYILNIGDKSNANDW